MNVQIRLHLILKLGSCSIDELILYPTVLQAIDDFDGVAGVLNFIFELVRGEKKVAGTLETSVLLANIYCLQFPGSLQGHKHG